MGRPKNEAREEARKFVGDGSLRQAIGYWNPKPSEEAIQKIIDACCFALKV